MSVQILTFPLERLIETSQPFAFVGFVAHGGSTSPLWMSCVIESPA